MTKKTYTKWIHGTGKTVRAKNAFLNALVEAGTIKDAAAKAGISRQTHYTWMDNDKEYAFAYAKAYQQASDILEEEAWRRAVEGDTRVVYYKGEKIDEQRVRSDELLALLLKGRKPMYRETQKVEVNNHISVADELAKARRRVAQADEEAADG